MNPRIKKFIPFLMMGYVSIFLVIVFMYIIYNIGAMIFNSNPIFDFWSSDKLRLYLILGGVLAMIIAHYLWDEVI